MLKYLKEKVPSEEIAPFLNPLYNYLKYIKIMSWLPSTDSNPATSGISANASTADPMVNSG